MSNGSSPKSFSVSESFRLRADSAAFWEAWVGSVLSRAGLYTIHHPFVVSQTAEARMAHGNTWDLDVSAEHPHSWELHGRCKSVEVKSLSQSFRTAKDYPYDDILVCSQNNFIRKWPGSSVVKRDFLFVSRETGAILWLPYASPVTLGHETYDKSRKELYMAVRASKQLLRDVSEFVEACHGE